MSQLQGISTIPGLLVLGHVNLWNFIRVARRVLMSWLPDRHSKAKAWDKELLVGVRGSTLTDARADTGLADSARALGIHEYCREGEPPAGAGSSVLELGADDDGAVTHPGSTVVGLAEEYVVLRVDKQHYTPSSSDREILYIVDRNKLHSLSNTTGGGGYNNTRSVVRAIIAHVVYSGWIDGTLCTYHGLRIRVLSYACDEASGHHTHAEEHYKGHEDQSGFCRHGLFQGRR